MEKRQWAFPVILLLSATASYSKCEGLCAVKDVAVSATHKIDEDVKTGILNAKKSIDLIEEKKKNILSADLVKDEGVKAATATKDAIADTAYAVKESAKAKLQKAKSDLAQKKAESSRTEAAQGIKHAARDSAQLVKEKAVAEAQAVKEATISTVNKAKRAYHHARAEHNRNAAQRQAKAARGSFELAMQEEIKAKNIS